MSRRSHRTRPSATAAAAPARSQRLTHVAGLAGSGLTGASVTWAVAGHGLWGLAGVITAALLHVLHVTAPVVVDAWFWRMAFRAVIREMRWFARHDHLSDKIDPKDLMKLAEQVHRRTLRARTAQSERDQRN
ncbi:hypothetical protein [Streptomyces sp. ISL-1]|uniref:hypothetical protein n=1 Tax=unclassified Streptomyces TaxID=2593676 RepID=UPI001BEA8FB6|nr:hypothetical protein [Streptomyces sp. ISL-1]MBT2392076.1 hypothetical protein [Streptomyces sp. ISL-1]